MSIIKSIGEYLTVVKRAVQNGDKIIEAIRTSAAVKRKKELIELGLPVDEFEISDEAVAEIMRRKEICAVCPFNSANAKILRNYSSDIPYQHCVLCSCKIGGNSSKEYCLSCKCGADAWNKRNPDLPKIDLKWDSFVETKKN